jgi:hypothetical protein
MILSKVTVITGYNLMEEIQGKGSKYFKWKMYRERFKTLKKTAEL